MSDAYQCDRCGELVEGEPRSTYTHDAHGLAFQADPKNGDLCDSCSKALASFIVHGD